MRRHIEFEDGLLFPRAVAMEEEACTRQKSREKLTSHGPAVSAAALHKKLIAPVRSAGSTSATTDEDSREKNRRRVSATDKA
jgi:hypothetical protein